MSALSDRPDPVHEPESEPAPEEKPGSGPGAFTFTGTAPRDHRDERSL